MPIVSSTTGFFKRKKRKSLFIIMKDIKETCTLPRIYAAIKVAFPFMLVTNLVGVTLRL